MQQPKGLARHPKCSVLYTLDTKRSMDSCKSSSSSLSSSSSKRYSTAVCTAPSVSYLSNMEISVTTKSLTGGPQYAITVHDRKSSSTWQYLRTYDQCRGFQQRMLSVMQRGHSCFSECPWLYTFIKRVFPRRKLFKYASPKVVEARRLALSRFFLTLQAVLVNPMNQSCSVLSGAVANEVVAFLTNHGDSEVLEPWQQLSPVSTRPLARTFSESFMGDELQLDYEQYESGAALESPMGSAFEDDGMEYLAAGEERFCCAMCALHQSSSDEQVFATWQTTSRLPSAFGRQVGMKACASALLHPLSPLDETAVRDHEGTPKEAYPFDDAAMEPASPSGSSVYDDAVEIDVSTTAKLKETAVRPSRLVVLPRRSLRALKHVTHALRHKLASPQA